MKARITKQRLIAAAGVGLVIVCCSVLYRVNPAHSNIYPPCIFHAVTGLHCPGCGTARALHKILHGNIGEALNLNPFAVVSMPFLLYAFVSYGLHKTVNRSLPSVFIPARYIWMLFGFIVVFWIVRNIPAYPFSVLAP